MEISSTKNDWLRKQCLNLNYFGTKQAWESIRNLNVTLAKVKPSSTKPMKSLMEPYVAPKMTNEIRKSFWKGPEKVTVGNSCQIWSYN